MLRFNTSFRAPTQANEMKRKKHYKERDKGFVFNLKSAIDVGEGNF